MLGCRDVCEAVLDILRERHKEYDAVKQYEEDCTLILENLKARRTEIQDHTIAEASFTDTTELTIKIKSAEQDLRRRRILPLLEREHIATVD